MDADIRTGAAVELGGFSLETIARLKASLDGMNANLRKLISYEEAYQFGAVEVALRGAAVSDSAGNTLVIDLGGPSYERLWQVRRITVGGALWSSVVSGSALLVVSPNIIKIPPISDVADQATSLPNVAFYSTGQLIVRHPGHLYIVVTSPSVSTQYGAGGAATDLPDSRHPIITPD